jgi:hypothetical protein
MSRRNLFFALTIVIIATLAFAIGESLGQRSMLKQAGVQLDGVQAMLLFDRIVEERKIKSLLAHGCATEAMTAIDHDENSDMKLLAEFANEKLEQSTITYIANRDPNLLKELKTFKSKYGNTWPEPECKN